MASRNYNTYRGTVKELIATVALNGKPLTQGFISQMLTYGVAAKQVGKVARPAGEKGKPASIIEVTSRTGLMFGPIPEPVEESASADSDGSNAVDASASASVAA